MTGATSSDAIISAFWRVLADRGWHGVTMRGIAAEAGIPLAELRRSFDGPQAILAAHGRTVDAAVLEGTVDDPSASARDRLFDVLMRRLDALQPDRAGVVRLMHDLPTAPLLALQLSTQMLPSMAWMLEAAGLDATGPSGLLRAKGLGTVWLAGLRAWEKDESADLSATMAALDRALDRADRIARMFGFAPREPAAASAGHTSPIETLDESGAAADPV
ncbi:TetR/AcrR family transcriptional regulator [Roseococcus sp. SYP-B2431]|uniref:helix-turn-helix domain-containing protein n=1 Tax=Roseococcus sp. SYP-B2431 TaxID=2496640 RepID=UPI00103E2F70|nr:helix-turn-helix domain-containing protein [Roseococcus sp. SYP-B2431]TCH96800.1 TetR/AcrR family transcriptional regulator [Roseococcus sp. SYP-B2431]